MPNSNGRRFFFDQNNFDLPDTPPEPEIVIPPPPTFSLEELGTTRDEATARGREIGLEEARVSREQYLAEQMERIARELRFLAGAEEYRAAVYEREVVSLTEKIFATVFPFFTEREGLEEVKHVISRVLLNHHEKPAITVELPAEDAEALEAYFRQMPDIDLDKVNFKSSPNLARGSCRMAWKDGGALRDHQGIADSVLKTLQQSVRPAANPEPADQAAPLDNPAEKDETGQEEQGD